MEASIDWLTCTFPESDFQHAMNSFEAIGGKAFPDNARSRYTRGWRQDPEGYFCANGPDQRGLVEFRGQSCKLIPREMLTDELHAFKCTRVDIAVDFRNDEIDILEFERVARDKGVKGFRNPPRLIKNPDGSYGCYVGASGKWGSGKCFVIYDKAAQQKVPGYWNRLECRWFNDHAVGCWKSICGGADLAGLCAGMFSIPLHWYHELGKAIEVKPMDRKADQDVAQRLISAGKQIQKRLAFIFEVVGADRYGDHVRELASRGASSLLPSERALIHAFQLKKENEEIDLM